MPTTNPTTLKLTEAERDRLRELGRLWGKPERPMSMAFVMRRMMWHPWEAETATATPTPKTPTAGLAPNRRNRKD